MSGWNNRRHVRGFGLVEAVIAVGLAGVLLFGGLTLAAQSQKEIVRAQAQQTLARVASDALAQRRASPLAPSSQATDALALPPVCADPAEDFAAATVGLGGDAAAVWLDRDGRRVPDSTTAAFRLDYRLTYAASMRAATIWLVVHRPAVENLPAAPSRTIDRYECISQIPVP